MLVRPGERFYSQNNLLTDGGRTPAIIYGLEKIFGFLQAFETIDDSHIRTKVSANYGDDCINPKDYQSIILLGLVDGTYPFRKLIEKWPGKLQEAKYFKNPHFYQECFLFG